MVKEGGVVRKRIDVEIIEDMEEEKKIREV